MPEKDNARKWLISQLPDRGFVAKALVRESFAGYLKADADHEVKVAHYPLQDECTLTVKRGVGQAREKSALLIDKQAFDCLYPIAAMRVHKRCHIIPLGAHELRFDEFLEPTALGRILMLEVKSPEGEALALPDEPWAEGAIDVTDDPRYLGQNLACRLTSD